MNDNKMDAPEKDEVENHKHHSRRAYLKNSNGTVVVDFCPACGEILKNYGNADPEEKL